MTAAAHGQRYIAVAGEVDRIDHVGDTRAANDHRWSPVDHAVPDFARRLVARLTRPDELTAYLFLELLYRRLGDHSRDGHRNPLHPSV